jgi:hypothetical protein
MMARQQRVLLREDPPAAWFLVDYFALLRGIGTPEVMAAQMRGNLTLLRISLSATIWPSVLVRP